MRWGDGRCQAGKLLKTPSARQRVADALGPIDPTLDGSQAERWLEVPAWMFDRTACADAEQEDISCLVLPIPAHAFFKQAVLQGEIGHDLLQGGRLATKVLHLTRPKWPMSAYIASPPVTAKKAAPRNSFDQP